MIQLSKKLLPLMLLALVACSQVQAEKLVRKFDLGNGPLKAGYTQLTETSIYTAENGMGFIPAGKLEAGQKQAGDSLTGDWIHSDKPFYFKIDLPEGRYKITITLGNPETASTTTVKAESRRLMLENIQTKTGEVVTKTIVVDLRTPKINDTLEVRRKPREMTYLNWDNSLSLEFNGPAPCVSSIVIEEANDLPIVFIAGDSTVTDQENEPWASWGQMFPRFLKPEIAVANYAESGETLRSFKRANRLAKILSVMRPGDYLFIEFAHNDQKPGGNHVEPFTTYQDEVRYFIAEAKKKGGNPVLVTSTRRRRFDDKGKLEDTLGDYPAAMRQLAKQDGLPLVDLNAMTKDLYEAMGVEDSKRLLVHYPANSFAGQEQPLADNTHFNAFGAYELAKCVVESLVGQKLPLAKHVVDDFKGFDPKKPDDWKSFFWPLSPSADVVKPDGN